MRSLVKNLSRLLLQKLPYSVLLYSTQISMNKSISLLLKTFRSCRNITDPLIICEPTRRPCSCLRSRWRPTKKGVIFDLYIIDVCISRFVSLFFNYSNGTRSTCLKRNTPHTHIHTLTSVNVFWFDIFWPSRWARERERGFLAAALQSWPLNRRDKRPQHQ